MIRRDQAPREWRPALLEREQNIATTARETWAFYTLAPTYTDGMSAAQLDAFIRDGADRVADLAGRTLWLRVTSAPFPCEDYRARLAEPIGDRAPEHVPGTITRDEIIDSAAWFPVDAAVEVTDGVVTRRLDSRWPVAVIGVKLADRRIDRCDIRRILAGEPEPASRQDVALVRAAYTDVTRSVARSGWAATPLDNDAFAWLFDASLALGHNVPMPRPGEASPLAGANVRTVQDPDGVTVPVRVEIDGDVETRHARVLRLAEWRGRDTEVLPAWIEWAMAQPYRVDIAARFEVVRPDESVESVRRAVRRTEGIVRHLEAFGKPLTETLRNAARRGPEIIDDMESGVASVGSQIHGQVLFAVSGATADEAVENAKTLKAAASRGRGDDDGRGPGLVLDSSPAQWAEWRKFLPLEPWTMRGHPQRQSPLMIATGLPHASRSAGDPTGIPFGGIGGSSDFYLFDLFGGVRRAKAGVWGVLGDQGSGKSSLLALAAWWGALVDRVPVTLLDPSGRITGQLRVPELWPHVREVRLDAQGPSGTLAPHFLTVDPGRDLYESDEEFESAVAAAHADRVGFAIDAALAAMPTIEVSRDPAVVATIREAIAGVGGEYGVQPSELIAAIDGAGEVGRRVARDIRSYQRLPGGRLLWGDRAAGADIAQGGDALVTVVSVAGVRTPSSPDPATWTTDEARSVTMLAGAAQLASAHVWRDRAAKLMLFDEATNLLAGASAVQSLMRRGALDSRKVTCSFGVAMHLAGSLDSIGVHTDAMFGAAALMRTERDNAAAALPMLRAARGLGWEDLAPRLDNGELIMSGWDDRVVSTRVDQSWLPDEFRRQLSTSTAARVEPLRTLFGARA